MGKSIEELEGRINSLYKEIIELQEPMTYKEREIYEDGSDYKEIGYVMDMSGHSDKWQIIYTKLFGACLKWAQEKYRNSKYVSDVDDDFCYDDLLINAVIKSLIEFDTEKDKNKTFKDNVSILLTYSIKSRYCDFMQEENTHGMRRKTDRLFQRLEDYMEYYGAGKKKSKEEIRALIVSNNANWSEKKIRKIEKSEYLNNQVALDAPAGDEDDSNVTVGDLIEDTKIMESFSEKEIIFVCSLMEYFFKSKNINNLNRKNNRAANCSYFILNDVLLKCSREMLVEYIRKYDFLKIHGDIILSLYDNKTQPAYSKKDYAKAAGIPVSKLSDTVYKNLIDFVRETANRFREK